MTKVYLSRCESYDVNEILPILQNAMTGLSSFDKLTPGAKVLVKPNLLMKRAPDRATTTHPSVVEALCILLKEHGCDVTIADTPGGLLSENILRNLYKETGMEGVAERTGAKLDTTCAQVDVEVKDAIRTHILTVLKSAAEADCIISVGKLKTHGLTAYTGAVKNLFGLIPGLLKMDYHARYSDVTSFSEALLDIASWAKPVLSVVDGIIGMEGAGPSGGSPRKVGALLVSDNPHALDVVGASLIGLSVEEVPTLTTAQRHNLLPVPEIIGESVESLSIPDFKHAPSESMRILTNPVFSSLIRSHPKVDPKICVGCGICARSCPGKAITLKNRVPKFRLKDCIRCYCCQELCPNTAISVWQPFFMKWLH